MTTSVFYDGACYLCSTEIEHYRKKDVDARLRFVDIADPAFRAESEGLDPVQVQAVMHVRDSQGNLRLGVDAFVAIWEVLPGYSVFARLIQWPGVNAAARLGYTAFANLRPYLPKRKSAAVCQTGTCEKRGGAW